MLDSTHEPAVQWIKIVTSGDDVLGIADCRVEQMGHKLLQPCIGYPGAAVIQAGLEVVQDNQEPTLIENAYQRSNLGLDRYGLNEYLVQLRYARPG